jgi:hypothetical protein
MAFREKHAPPYRIKSDKGAAVGHHKPFISVQTFSTFNEH